MQPYAWCTTQQWCSQSFTQGQFSETRTSLLHAMGLGRSSIQWASQVIIGGSASITPSVRLYWGRSGGWDNVLSVQMGRPAK